MKNNRKHNQKMRKEANALIEKGLLEMGATKVPDACKEGLYWRLRYTLPTKFGMLSITFDDPTNDNDASICYSVYSRFEETEQFNKELKEINANHFSGKWNWCEYVEGVEPERFANMVLFHIGKVKL
jgi:hypothetical protein